ncbi:MAG: diadenylate cyclase CdaA [Lachnospiraceae bacterium]|nr:diadenylate cyclase CdaA [Lachnospiraceae bacterium]
MENVREIWSSLRRSVQGIEFGDVFEILIIAYLVYHIVLWIKTTRAWVLLKGLIVLGAFWVIAFAFKMHTILWLGENILGYAITAIVIILQPELRKALEELGKKSLVSVLPFDSGKRDGGMITERTIGEIVKACMEMSKVKTGALIVIEREQSLVDYERTGIDVDAILSSQLLINIFEHNTPLHDGAVIVRGNRVTSATCYLPLSDQSNISKELGTRHRAGVGISEVADSITVIVSEQTGKISVAVDGDLERNFDGEKLKSRLLELVNVGEKEQKKQKKQKKIGKGKKG